MEKHMNPVKTEGQEEKLRQDLYVWVDDSNHEPRPTKKLMSCKPVTYL